MLEFHIADVLPSGTSHKSLLLKFCAAGVLSLCIIGSACGQTESDTPEPPVCNRTLQVQNEIVAAIGDFASGVSDCGDVTSTYLATITLLSIDDRGITQLQASDFNGLIRLRWLSLHANQLQMLPADIFDSLTSLQTFYISNNQLQSLAEDIFDGLTNLGFLYLNNNQLQSLAEDIFNGSTNLVVLDLSENQLQTLPADIFDGLTKLRILHLNNNQLQTLPADIFDGLTNLSDLNLENNPFNDGLPSALIEEAKEFVENGGELHLDIVAVNGALTALNVPVNRMSSVNLEDAFILFEQGTSSPAESYEITVVNDEVATVTEIIGHTLTVKALNEGETEIEVIGIHTDQRAAQSFTVTANLVCERTLQVRDSIVDAIDGVSDCGDVTSAHLATITTLDLNNRRITQLQSNDFNDLVGLTELDLSNNRLQTLPADIFDPISETITSINLQGNPFGAGLPSALIDYFKTFSNTLRVDLAAVQDVLQTTTLALTVGTPMNVDLEDAFFYAVGTDTRNPADSYEITVAYASVATATATASGHTLTITATSGGQTDIDIVGEQRAQGVVQSTATQTLSVEAEAQPQTYLKFRIKVFLEGAQ